MGRIVRDAKLETREARRKLAPQREPYWRGIHEGLQIGYRKHSRGGSWIVRLIRQGAKTERKLSAADDHRDADGEQILSYGQAVKKAMAFVEHLNRQEAGSSGPVVKFREVADRYWEEYELHGRAIEETRYLVYRVIVPKWGNVELSSITTARIERWLRDLVNRPRVPGSNAKKSEKDGEEKDSAIPPKDSPEHKEYIRKRKNTANRIFNAFRAILNFAFKHGYVDSDAAWKRVKRFEGVDTAKCRFLSLDECNRLLNACSPDLRELVSAALLTGSRYGELRAMLVRDYHLNAESIYVRPGKTGKARHVPLTDEGKEFFDSLTAGRNPDEHMFLRSSGQAWEKSDQRRPMRAACKQAKISPPVTFHDLRHAYASQLAQKSVPLQVIASALGHTTTRMTEKHYAHLLPSYVNDTIKNALPSFGVPSNNVVRLDRRKYANQS